MKDKKLLFVFIALFALYAVASIIARAANEVSLHDGSGNMEAWSILAVDESSQSETRQIIVDGSNYLLVNGIGTAGCDTIEVDKVTVAATATGTVSTSTTSVWFTVSAESGNPDVIYFLPGTTDPTATTGIELLQGGIYAIPANQTDVMFYNAAATQATATVMWCY